VSRELGWQVVPLLLTLAAIALGSIALSGCGQTGPLTLPGAAENEEQDEDGEEQ
jgi:predicted small lipoprotein YifL